MHRHGNEPLGQNRLVEGDMLDSAGQQDRDPVALAEALRHQRQPAAADLVAEVPPRQAPPISGRGVEGPVGFARRRGAQAPLEELRQRLDFGQIVGGGGWRGRDGSCRHDFYPF